MQQKKFLVIGAGFAGAVIAERLVNKFKCKVVILDERSHIGGNCYTERDPSTNVMVHKYGPHIFNTNNKEVWDYISQFCEMVPFVNRVKSVYREAVYSMPINLHTINQFFNKVFNPREAMAFIESLADKSIVDPQNFEEQAVKFIGADLYKAFFYGYTKKQWGCEPAELPAAILKRLPVRFNYDDNYYSSLYQGIPKGGYTAIFENMLAHSDICLRLNTKFDPSVQIEDFDHVFYSGPIDSFFNYKYGHLGYRTVLFEKHEAVGDFQGNAVVNYADPHVEYTRIHEHKHFTPWESHDKTTYFKEFSKETTSDDVPFYPKRLMRDMEILKLYQVEVDMLTNYSFVGRLATYRYMDMHHVIADAMEAVEKIGQND
jgi:UDP-galactopyranose mutase